MSARAPKSAIIFDHQDSTGSSVQHFAHFMKDYFIDIALWCDKNPGKPIVVRECGPCTPWFDLLTDRNTVTILSRDELTKLAQRFPDSVHTVTGVRMLVRPAQLARLSRFRDAYAVTEQSVVPSRVLAVRSKEPAFYLSPESEVKTSGPSRRRIGNQARVSAVLRRFWSFRVIEFFDLSPRESLALMSNCSVFVAQRGAALMNLLFMPAGGTVIEIYPENLGYKDKHADLYRRACHQLGLTYVRVAQKSKVSPVSLRRLVLALVRQGTLPR